MTSTTHDTIPAITCNDISLYAIFVVSCYFFYLNENFSDPRKNIRPFKVTRNELESEYTNEMHHAIGKFGWIQK